MYVPERVLTNADLEKHGRDLRRVDRRAHRHPRAPHRRRPTRHRPTSPLIACAARARDGGPRRRGRRPHHRRHHDSRPHPALVRVHACSRSWAPRTPRRSTCSPRAPGFMYGLGIARGADRRRRRRHRARDRRRDADRASWTSQDRNTCVLFGDGAGAAVLQAVRAGRRACWRSTCTADGELGDVLEVPAGGSAQPAQRTRPWPRASTSSACSGNEAVQVRGARDGGELARRAAPRPRRSARTSSTLLIPHQANQRIIDAGARAARDPDGQGHDEHRPLRQHVVGLDPDRARRGACAAGRLKPGDLIGMVAFGGGATWGAASCDGPMAASPDGAPRGAGSSTSRRSRRGARVKLAFLFPGQGAQAVGMGQALAERFPSARDVFDDRGPRARLPALATCCWKGPDEELKQTVNAQPALLTHSVAALAAARGGAGVQAACAAGHSLGEYSACVAAGRARVRGRAAPRAPPRRAHVRRRGSSGPAPWPRSSGSTATRSRRRAPRRRRGRRGAWPRTSTRPGRS